jgi:hypothetical protein
MKRECHKGEFKLGDKVCHVNGDPEMLYGIIIRLLPQDEYTIEWHFRKLGSMMLTQSGHELYIHFEYNDVLKDLCSQ